MSAWTAYRQGHSNYGCGPGNDLAGFAEYAGASRLSELIFQGAHCGAVGRGEGVQHDARD